ncbi:MAG TPA: sialidase family protein [Actinomycetota bacterium]|nr:sialidase family protein [Actinomycetota bacterium]
MRRRRSFGLLVALTAAIALAFPMTPAFAADTEVSVDSPPNLFAQNKQNEPGVAVNAFNPMIVAAGSNDEIDLEACNAGDPTTCPFTEGVGVSGVYFSFDGGSSWIQPTYTGYSARNCLGPEECVPDPNGPIGTLPHYYENGLIADGDPSLAFGPLPGPDGFAWENGARLYYANLAGRFPSSTPDESFKGFEAIAVSRTDDPEAAAANDASAWLDPVIVSKQNSALFADHEQIWADNAELSPYFGNVYVCFAAFRSQEKGGALPNPITVARSTDAGDSWKSTQVTDASNNPTHGQQDCWVRTDSDGVVYVFWEAIKSNTGRAIYMVRSFNGGRTFDKQRRVSNFDPTGIGGTFDGVAGARDGTFPTADIANGAPSGADATDEIVVAWQDGPTPSDEAPGPNETVNIAYSTDKGEDWAITTDGAEATDRPNMPAIAISPNGTDVYLDYNAFLVPWQSTTEDPRPMQSVVRHAESAGLSGPSGWTTLFRGGIGDARASSANGLTAEFLGDYNNAAATRAGFVPVYVDVRDAEDCPAIDEYRQSIVDGDPIATPEPNNDCPPTFGNTDIFGGNFPDPSP